MVQLVDRKPSLCLENVKPELTWVDIGSRDEWWLLYFCMVPFLWGFLFCGCAPVISVPFSRHSFSLPWVTSCFWKLVLSQGTSRGRPGLFFGPKSTFLCFPLHPAWTLMSSKSVCCFDALLRVQQTSRTRVWTELAHRHGLFSPQSFKNLEVWLG